jgi:hypothetical protein
MRLFLKKKDFIEGGTLAPKKVNDNFGWTPATFIVEFFFF